MFVNVVYCGFIPCLTSSSVLSQKKKSFKLFNSSMPKLPNIIYEMVKIRQKHAACLNSAQQTPQVLNAKLVIFVKYAYNLW